MNKIKIKVFYILFLEHKVKYEICDYKLWLEIEK